MPVARVLPPTTGERPPPPPLRHEGRWLALICALALGQLLAWTALDRRNPDDHDEGHTEDTALAVADAAERGLGPALVDFWSLDRRYPPGVTSTLIVTSTLAGPSRAAFRLANLPFLLLLVVGTWWLGRQLRGPRLGLLAAGVVAGLPMLVNGSRKMFVHWHAAALTPLGLAAGLFALGSPRALAWLGFGGLQGLRLYTHHASSIDALATLAAVVGLGLLRPATRRRAPLALVAFALVGSVALGLVGPPRTWSLPGYLDGRGSALAVLGPLLNGEVDAGTLAARVVGEGIWIALFPLNALVLGAGLLLAPWTRRRPDQLVLLLLLLQVPALLLTCANGAFLNDWAFLLPGAVVLGLAAFIDRAPSSWIRPLAATLLLHAVAVAWGPLIASPFAPDPIARPGAWDLPGLRWLGRSDTGRWSNTHLVPTREPDPWDEVARRLVQRPGLTLADLTYIGVVGPGCRVASPLDPSSWRWELPSQGGWSTQEPPKWPLLFAGAGYPQPPDQGVLLVRLWVDFNSEAGQASCDPLRRLPLELLRGAEGVARVRWPGSTRWEGLDDPTGRTPGWTVEWERTQGWTGAALLGQRGG